MSPMDCGYGGISLSHMTSMTTMAMMAMAMMTMMEGQLVSSLPQQRNTEFCENENFKGKCATNQVIVMNSARYGRMAIGRCMSVMFRDSCSMNVKSYFDNLCSGHQTCEVPVRDLLIEVEGDKRPCPKDFSMYLQAKYTCIDVASPPEAGCGTGSDDAAIVTTPSGYISSTTPRDKNCGGLQHPWVLQVGEGRRINITMIMFKVGSNGGGGGGGRGSEGSSVCQVVAVIKEKNLSSRTICRYNQKKRNVYISATNRVEIRIIRNLNSKFDIPFLLHHEGFGCLDVNTSEFSWFRRQRNDKALLGCKLSKQTWTLVCVNDAWKGIIGKCPGEVKTITETSLLRGTAKILTPVSIMTVLLIAFVVGIVMLLVGILCLRRTPSQSGSTPSSTLCAVDRDRKGWFQDRPLPVPSVSVYGPDTCTANDYRRTCRRNTNPSPIDCDLDLPPPPDIMLQEEPRYEQIYEESSLEENTRHNATRDQYWELDNGQDGKHTVNT